MVVNCIFCGKKKEKNNLSFHKLPLKHPNLLEQWLQNMNLGPQFQPTGSMKLCSDHFSKHLLKRVNSEEVLLPGSVPTIFDNYKSACVYCYAKKSDEKKRSFHIFPLEKPLLLEKWITAMNLQAFTPSKQSFLCSDHFEECCYRANKSDHCRRLKPNVVPSLFEPLSKKGKMAVKHCIASCCINNSLTSSNKLFIRVPMPNDCRQKWYNAVSAKKKFTGTAVFVCEDHFDLENDAENWMKYKLLGNKLHMKKNVVPHKNLSENLVDNMFSQISASDRKLKEINRQALKCQKQNLQYFENDQKHPQDIEFIDISNIQSPNLIHDEIVISSQIQDEVETDHLQILNEPLTQNCRLKENKLQVINTMESNFQTNNKQKLKIPKTGDNIVSNGTVFERELAVQLHILKKQKELNQNYNLVTEIKIEEHLSPSQMTIKAESNNEVEHMELGEDEKVLKHNFQNSSSPNSTSVYNPQTESNDVFTVCNVDEIIKNKGYQSKYKTFLNQNRRSVNNVPKKVEDQKQFKTDTDIWKAYKQHKLQEKKNIKLPKKIITSSTSQTSFYKKLKVINTQALLKNQKKVFFLLQRQPLNTKQTMCSFSDNIFLPEQYWQPIEKSDNLQAFEFINVTNLTSSDLLQEDMLEVKIDEKTKMERNCQIKIEPESETFEIN